MFPLGTVLFPSLYLPLHLFEPRYLELAVDCLGGDQEFGVVLIERGSEVGGDDVRSAVGTVARIVESSRLDDGRVLLATVGTRRIRITELLPDDPYPRAEVEGWEDPPAGPALAGLQTEATALLRRTLVLKAELDEPAAPVDIALSDDPVLSGYQASAVAPLGPLDQQRLLAAPTAEARAGLLVSLLDEEADHLTRRLAAG
ncbi:LON peptidase substrate-binding domain-containing protein [soil metagenome]